MKLYAFILALFFAANVYSDTVYKSSLLEIREGFIGDALGVAVESVSFEDEQTIIQLELPDFSGGLDNLKLLDSSNNAVPVKKRYEVIKDHENNPRGLIIYLDKRHKRSFKIVYDVTESD